LKEGLVLPSLVLAGCLSFGHPFCLQCDDFSHRFLLDFCPIFIFSVMILAIDFYWIFALFLYEDFLR
jgi:hypothetical protein